MNHSLQNKVVVLGGVGYVGVAVAKRLATEGATLALLYRGEKDTHGILSSLPGKGHKAYRCDLQSETETEETLAYVEKDLGPIYGGIFAAGMKPKRQSLLQASLSDVQEQLQGNFIPGFFFLKACARRLKEHTDGVLVGLITIGVIKSEEARTLGAYIPAKYALQGTLSLLKEELAPFSVRVYSVAPGFMEEGMNGDVPKAFVEMVRQKSPGKKLVTAEDVAETVAYLCRSSEQNLTHEVQLGE
jgi:NAD(P)-dependent dehydrogenase (short-subunit alcohol dehydrogenase family)